MSAVFGVRVGCADPLRLERSAMGPLASWRWAATQICSFLPAAAGVCAFESRRAALNMRLSSCCSDCWCCAGAAAPLGAAVAATVGCGAAGNRAGVPRPNHHHAPAPSASTITISAHSGLRPRRAGVNGVPRSGAWPRRRLASDFFNASRISDMGASAGSQPLILPCDTSADRIRPARTARTGSPDRRCRPA